MSLQIYERPLYTADMYSSEAVANFFIKKSGTGDGQAVNLSPMKLQKLLYFAHGWHLAFIGQPLLNEAIQAWDYGPVVESLYHHTKHFGNRNIDTLLPSDNTIINEDSKKLLNAVWNRYKSFSAIQLSNMTHAEGTPWKKKFLDEMKNNGQLRRAITLDDETIKTYFEELKNRASSSN